MNDYSHCPNKEGAYFSPVAPSELCQANTVPEPSSLVLVLLAVAVMMTLRRRA